MLLRIIGEIVVALAIIVIIAVALNAWDDMTS